MNCPVRAVTKRAAVCPRGPSFQQRERRSVALLALILFAVMLDAGDAQAGHAAAVDRALPAGKLFKAQRIALAGFIDAQQAARDGGDHFGLAADHPAGRRLRRQRIDGQRLAERTDDLGWPEFLILEHYASSKPISACRCPPFTPAPLKII